VVDECPGFVKLDIGDCDFSSECGGHRWQRVPPNERYGRRQSSTVTVAVVGQVSKPVEVSDSDIRLDFFVSSVGAGGQNRQKNMTACRAVHMPTGIEACCQDERSQRRNKEKAKAELRRRVRESAEREASSITNSSRRNQIGSGQRGDKIRTVQMHNGVATNHVNGKRMSADRYIKGFIEELW